jgi:hypothetical protein
MLVGTTNLNTTLNLTYVLTDVVETLLLAFIKLLIDRCGDDDKKMFAFYNYIKSYPSQLGLELSDEKSVFAHIFN